MPTQRICRYPLLINELLKKTPAGHADLPFLNKAIECYTSITQLVNEETRKQDRIAEVKALQLMIDRCPDISSNTERHLLKQGPMIKIQMKGAKKAQSRHFFLVCARSVCARAHAR
jgi:hypothetical protein